MSFMNIKSCRKCLLHTCRTNVVPGDGNLSSSIVFIGEAPGEQEDRQGKPFIGASGQLLDKLLQSIYIDRSQVYITNLIKCRPPNNRNPFKNEVEACSPHLMAEMSEISPKLVVTVGKFATESFLGEVNMQRVHGILFRKDDKIILPVFHPAAGLHDPSRLLDIKADFANIPLALKSKIEPRVFGKHAPHGTYNIVDGVDEIKRDIKDCTGLVAVDTETRQDKSMWCLSYSIKVGTAKVVLAKDKAEIALIGKWLSNPDITTIIHNALFDVPVLQAVGINPAKVHDTMVMAYLLQTEPQGLKALSYRYCNLKMNSYMDVVGKSIQAKAIVYLFRVLQHEWEAPKPVLYWKDGLPKIRKPQQIETKIRKIIKAALAGTADPYNRWYKIAQNEGRGPVEDKLGIMPMADLSDVDRKTAVEYSAEDADATLRLYPFLLGKIQTGKMMDVFETDMGIVQIVSDMMIFGIRIDKDKFQDLDRTFQERMRVIESTVDGVAGKKVNPASPLQIAELFYDKLGLGKRLKGRSTDRNALAAMLNEHPIVQEIINYRTYNKLSGTYAKAVPLLAKEDSPGEWRIHADFRTTRTVTGRLSASNPNLMAQPVRSSEGREIRNCYVASDGCVFVSVDYSQVEMRVAADNGNDSRMLGYINDEEDIHTQTAAFMFNLAIEDVDEEKHRYPAKKVGFGILYGIGPEGLRKQFVQGGASESHWTVEQCQGLIDKWFDMYKGIASYMRRSRFSAKHTGMVKDMWGRVRHVPGALSPNRSIQERALRQACNDPIQGGAQGIIKRAMRDLTPLYISYNKKGRICRPLIQIHDDILFEIRKDILSEVVPQVVKIMESVAPFMKVGLKVDPKVGERWGSLEKWDGDCI